jgi:hypothetical protein
MGCALLINTNKLGQIVYRYLARNGNSGLSPRVWSLVSHADQPIEQVTSCTAEPMPPRVFFPC